jgi:hypothetical protein
MQDFNLQSHFIGALKQLPEIRLTIVEQKTLIGSWRADLVVQCEVKGNPVRLLVEETSAGYPRDIRVAKDQIEGLRNINQPIPDIPVVISRSLTNTSRAMLRDARIGYWDSSESLYLDVPWATFWIDRPVPAGRPRSLRNIFRGSSAQVLHALLLEPGKSWGVVELAAVSSVSPSTVHDVFSYLEDQLWVERHGRGPQSFRVLRHPNALIDAWVEAHSLANYRSERFYLWMDDPQTARRAITQSLDSHQIDYAFTLSTGAHIVAPFATDSKHLWLLASEDADLNVLTEATRLERVNDGENITILRTKDHSPLMFRQQHQCSWIASDVQLFLDLSVWPQRGREQAAHLRRERLGY